MGAPLSPWGASRGVPGRSLGGVPDPKSAAQKLPSPLGFGIVFSVDFDIDF